jgi:hypothetical protein
VAGPTATRRRIEPVRNAGLLGLLAGWAPLDEDFPEIADAAARAEDVFG